MFHHIMAPVDLRHPEKLGRALKATSDAARHYKARVTYVSVAGEPPNEIAHTPEEFKEKLAAFAKEQAKKDGIEADSHAVILHDPRVDLDDALVEAADIIGADLVIMASHTPDYVSHFWSSNGGAVASHSGASVMVVRDP